MKNNKEHIILFGPGGCLTRKTIEMYIDGKIAEPEKKKILQHTRNCELCADAIEGTVFFSSSKQYSRSIENMHNSPWRRSQDREPKSRKLFMGISSIAASVALLFGLFYIFQMKNAFDKKGNVLEQPVISAVAKEKSPVVIKDLSNVEENKNESSSSNISSGPVLRKARISEPVEVLDENVIVADESDIEIENEEISNLSTEKIIMLEIPEEKDKSEVLSSQALGSAGYMSDKEVAATEPVLSKADKRRSSTEKKEERSASKAYYVAEVMPMFKGGGVDTFNKYIADSLKVILPDSVWYQSIIVSFRITAEGKIDNVKLLSGTSSKELNHRVVELVENSPEWIPASISGAPVAVDEQIEIVLNK